MTPGNKKPDEVQWKKVAIAITEDGAISPTHFGDAEAILFAEVRPGEFKILEIRPNPVKQVDEGRHGSDGKLKKAAGFMKDVHIVATGKLSGNFKKMHTEKGKWPFITKLDPEPFLNWLIHSFPALECWFSDPNNTVYRT
ncbi:MAG: hypothetical protein DRJ08_00090 [Acidobacteria bacterium]|nr:MAG: hypothetical protein DRJ08_00090 [Acidobacteriota bacterium]